jgi:predicted nucleic acid-binding protein
MSSGWLLDTNIVFELRKQDEMNSGLREWFSGIAEEEIYLSVVTLGEIRKVLETLRNEDTIQSIVFERWLETLQQTFWERLLWIDPDISNEWGKLQAIRRIPSPQGFLAATALRQDLTLVTQDVEPYQGLGIEVLNPFVE